MKTRYLITLALCAALTACGSDGDDGGTPPPGPVGGTGGASGNPFGPSQPGTATGGGTTGGETTGGGSPLGGAATEGGTTEGGTTGGGAPVSGTTTGGGTTGGGAPAGGTTTGGGTTGGGAPAGGTTTGGGTTGGGGMQSDPAFDFLVTSRTSMYFCYPQPLEFEGARFAAAPYEDGTGQFIYRNDENGEIEQRNMTWTFNGEGIDMTVPGFKLLSWQDVNQASDTSFNTNLAADGTFVENELCVLYDNNQPVNPSEVPQASGSGGGTTGGGTTDGGTTGGGTTGGGTTDGGTDGGGSSGGGLESQLLNSGSYGSEGDIWACTGPRQNVSYGFFGGGNGGWYVVDPDAGTFNVIGATGYGISTNDDAVVIKGDNNGTGEVLSALGSIQFGDANSFSAELAIGSDSSYSTDCKRVQIGQGKRKQAVKGASYLAQEPAISDLLR